MRRPRHEQRRTHACRFSLAANPRLSSWIKFRADGQVTVSPGKVEIGQGIVTALAQIAADELDVDIGRVQMVRATTAASPNEGVTSGSLSIQHSGRALRAACAEIRQIFLAAASDRLGVDAGRARDRGRHDLGSRQCQDQLLGARRRSLARPRRDAGRAAKPIAQRALAGQSVQRIDIPDKVFAQPRFIHDTALPGPAAWPGAAAGTCAGEAASRLKEDAARAVPASSRSCATAILRAWSARPRPAPRPRSRRLRKGATWSAGERAAG